jgi:hypothetical protein
MGIEVESGQSQLSKDYEKLRNDLQLMVNKFDFQTVVTELRKIYEKGAENE